MTGDGVAGETGRYVSVFLDEALLAEIDDFRFEKRFESRTAAIRWLLRTAVDLKLAPAAAVKKVGA